jgi:hypothetical protein
MTIETIKQTELTSSEREVLAEDRKRWKRMGAGAHLDEWLAYYPGCGIRRRLAMRIAFTNRPEGRAYTQAMNQLLEADGINTNDKSAMAAFTAVLWLGDDSERMTILREIREAMTPGQRSRLNSPIAARQRVLAVLKARAGGTEENMRMSPVSLLKQALVKKEHVIADLEERLAAAESRDGSLFDLKRDNADNIEHREGRERALQVQAEARRMREETT